MISTNVNTEVADDALYYDFLSDYEISNFSDMNLPYHHKFKNPLDVKNNILISGFIPHNASRFNVDLISNRNKHPFKKMKEIVFHFNPRFNQNCVVRNSYIDGEWGTEEVHAIKKNPFVRGQTFFMEIFVAISEYLVSVNGVHFCKYSHRIPPSYVDSINVSGEIKLIKVESSKRELYPSTERTVYLMDDHLETKNSRFFHEFKYPLMIGWDLSIYGSILEKADRFAVDLLNTNENEDRRRNIAFHINPRISQHYIVRNSFIRGEWGVEECHAICKSPLQRKKLFLLEIFVTEKHYMVSVNGNHFCNFRHRLPINAVDSFEVYGDISLQRIDICLRDGYPLLYNTLYPDLNKLNEQLNQPIRYFLDHPLKMDNSVIEIKGRVLLLPSEFFINLQYGKTSVPHPIIPFHISMRWHPDGENSTVLNSWTKDHWDEEFVLFSLLRPNSNFTVTIYIKREGFSTVVKAPIKPYSTVLPLFAHRSELSIINNIYIQE